MEKIIRIEDVSWSINNYSMYEGYAVITDKQTIRLGIDNSRKCCENWGYFWCNDDVNEFVGASVLGVSITDSALNQAIMQANDVNDNDRWFEGRVMFVNIDTDRGVLQFVAYNEHNGYYSHEARVECEQLVHEDHL